MGHYAIKDKLVHTRNPATIFGSELTKWRERFPPLPEGPHMALDINYDFAKAHVNTLDFAKYAARKNEFLTDAPVRKKPDHASLLTKGTSQQEKLIEKFRGYLDRVYGNIQMPRNPSSNHRH